MAAGVDNCVDVDFPGPAYLVKVLSVRGLDGQNKKNSEKRGKSYDRFLRHFGISSSFESLDPNT